VTQQRLCLEAGNGGVSVQVHSCDTQRATYSADAGQTEIGHKVSAEICKTGMLCWLRLPGCTPLALSFCESVRLSMHQSVSVCSFH